MLVLSAKGVGYKNMYSSWIVEVRDVIIVKIQLLEEKGNITYLSIAIPLCCSNGSKPRVFGVLLREVLISGVEILLS